MWWVVAGNNNTIRSMVHNTQQTHESKSLPFLDLFVFRPLQPAASLVGRSLTNSD